MVQRLLDARRRRAAPPGRQAGRVTAWPRRQPAQALLEFALGSSVIAVLLVGASDLPRLFYYDVVASGAAAQGARAAATGAPDADVIAAARDTAPGALSAALVITVVPAASARTYGTTPVWTTVTVSYPFEPVTPLASHLLADRSTITRSVSQRMRGSCAPTDGTPC